MGILQDGVALTEHCQLQEAEQRAAHAGPLSHFSFFSGDQARCVVVHAVFSAYATMTLFDRKCRHDPEPLARDYSGPALTYERTPTPIHKRQ